MFYCYSCSSSEPSDDNKDDSDYTTEHYKPKKKKKTAKKGGRRPKAIMRENVSSNSEPPQQQVLVPQLVRVPQLLTAPGIQLCDPSQLPLLESSIQSQAALAIHQNSAIQNQNPCLISGLPPEVTIINSCGKQGVFALAHIESGVRYGPYKGLKIAEEDLMEETNDFSCMWEVNCGESTYYVDAHKDANSSWLKCVRFARNKDEQNLAAFQHRRNIYYMTIKPIHPSSELLVWYGDQYLQEINIGDNTASFVCKGCSTSFISFDVFELHRKTCSSTPYFSCQTCEKRFPTLFQYHLHIREHRDNLCKKSEKFECNICHKLYTTRVGLKNHRLRMHSAEKPEKCPHCDKRFVHKAELRQHMQVHNERHLKCCYCDRMFAYQALLDCHLRYTHTEVKNYQCHICGNRYKTANHCKLHISRSHGGIKEAEQ